MSIECIGEIPGVKDVMLLHVIDATHPSRHGWTHGQHVKDAKNRLAEQKEHLEKLGLTVDTKVDIITDGNVSDVILKIAADEKVSLIIMSAKGNSLHVLIMRNKLVECLEGEKFEKFCPRILSKVLCPTDFSEPAVIRPK